MDAIPPPHAADVIPRNVITISDVTAAIDRFLAGQIEADQLLEWADRCECRETVEYDSGPESDISQALF
jgi:hypothetical protein